jgi:phage gp29-like protein
MIPKQATFKMLDGKASNGDGKLQGGFKDACNEEMAIKILGNTETTSASKSSGYAQSKEHGEQQDEIIASDLIFVENELNSEHFLNILKSYGFDVEGGEFEYELDLNLAKLKLRMEIDFKVSEKVPVEDDYWYDTYGIPKPKNYEALKKEMEAKKSANQLPAKEVDKTEKTPKEKVAKEDLADFANPTILDQFFKKMADFFDHARH